MSIDKIVSLLELMKKYDVVELEMKEGEFGVALRKAGAFAPSVQPAAAHAVPHPPPAGADPDLQQITSPIVGTFYGAPSPESPPFVEEGGKVGRQTVVCIIEAMKIMNEIKAEMEGVIEKVLVESGEPVEYGQPLFLVRRSGS